MKISIANGYFHSGNAINGCLRPKMFEENLPMATIIEQSELVSRALVFLSEKCAENPDGDLAAMLDEAGMRFNLGPGDAAALKDFSERKLWKEKNGPKNKNSRTALCGSDFFREDVFIGKFLCGLRPRPSGRTSPYPAIPAGYQTRAQDAKPRRALLPIWLAGRRLVAAKYFFHEPVLRIALFRDISASPRKHPKLSRRFAWKERKKSAGSAQA